MDLQSLVGQTFFENEFYELLLFEIEENFSKHLDKYIHFYFDRTPDKKIKISEIVFFKTSNELDKTSRKIIEKKEWFEIIESHGHIDLVLVRFDRTGSVSVVYRNSPLFGDSTRTQEWKMGWADEKPSLGRPLTPEEIRKGFQELAGIFEDQIEKQKLGPKKAV